MSVDVGYIASSESTPGFAIQNIQSNQSAPSSDNFNVTMSGLSSVSQAALVLNQWSVQFPEVHNLYLFQGGPGLVQWINQNVVTYGNLPAYMLDNSNHVSDPTLSKGSAFVIAAP